MREISRVVRTLVLFLPLLLAPACATTPPRQDALLRLDLATRTWTAGDGRSFPFSVWSPAHGAPAAVLVGVHGLSGAVKDQEALGRSLQQHGFAYYGYELRGQGNDPDKASVGDIKSPREWVEDLAGFHRLVQARHPGKPVVWFGESLGALIVCSSAAVAAKEAGPSAIILASPIPAFDERVALWHRQLIGLAAIFDPQRKIPLKDWAAPADAAWQMTSHSQHLAQLEQTPWAVQSYTVRFYHALSVLVGRMQPQAGQIRQPVLIAHAAHDAFAGNATVEAFARRLPDAELKVYGNSHHLLFYDVERDKVIEDVVRWVETSPWRKVN